MSKSLESFLRPAGILMAPLAFVVLALGHALPVNAQTFLDVPPSHWAYDFIEEMAALGITSGCGGGNYCPEATVTRAQMAVFVVRAQRRPRVVDGNGDIIGDLVSMRSGDAAGRVSVMNGNGYFIGELHAATGTLADVWILFSGPNCTGAAYVDGMGGTVAGVGSNYYYVPRDAVALADFTSVSALTASGCSALAFSRPYVWPALPNDPVVTGVPDEPYVLPIGIEQR